MKTVTLSNRFYYHELDKKMYSEKESSGAV